MGTIAYYARPSDATAPSMTWSLNTGTIGDSNFPLAHLHDGIPHTVTKITHSGTVKLDGDCGSSIVLGLVSVIAHNIPVGSTVTVRRSDSSTFASGNVDTVMTIPAVREDGLSVNPFVDLSAVAAKRYLRFDITATGTEIAIGDIRAEASTRTFTTMFQQDARPVETAPKTVVRSAAGAQVEYRQGVTLRQWAAPTWKLNATSRTELLTLIRGCRVTPVFVFVPDSTVNEAWVVRFVNEPVIESLKGPALWVTSATLEEVSAGVPV